MNSRCSCGATLVEGALFCHLCGQPQREDLIERERQAQAPAITPAVETMSAAIPPADSTGFNSHRGTRAALTAAIPCFFLVPLVSLFLGGAGVLILIPAGFFAAHLYSKGAVPGDLPLSAWFGARLGWMTGLITFVFMLIPLVLSMLLSPTPLRDVVRNQIEQQPNAEVEKAVELLNSPAGVFAFVATLVVFLFVTFTVLGALGGALSAQMQIKSGEKKLT